MALSNRRRKNTTSRSLGAQIRRGLLGGVLAFLLLALGGIVATALVYFWVAPSLPSLALLRNIELQAPLRIYSRHGGLIAEFGNERRRPLAYHQIPPLLIDAFLAAEDARFFAHPGISVIGLTRAAIHLALTGHKTQGGGTISMQVARNYFLGHQKTYIRKIREVFLALRLAHDFSKEEVLRLYLNKIYFGNHAYGLGAAAAVYYGTPVSRLTLPEMALLAGLPQAPSLDNPVASPRRARARRAYVLGRMLKLGYINRVMYRAAMRAPIRVRLHGPKSAVHAPYVAAMVLQYMDHRFGKAATTLGYKVITTISARLQHDANQAYRRDLEAYGRVYGYRGPSGFVPDLRRLSAHARRRAIHRILRIHGLRRGLVLAVGRKSATVLTRHGPLHLGWSALSWARPFHGVSNVAPPITNAHQALRAGDLIYVMRNGAGRWMLAQIPWAEGGLVSLDPKDGAVRALVGGFSYRLSNFNRVTEAYRQPGSSFKPFVYSAALHWGMTPATVINDAPIVIANAQRENIWKPGNYTGRFFGPTRLRVALARSRNLVSVRLLDDIGVGYALNYIRRFGLNPRRLPHDLTLVLGSADVTPWSMARGYAVFANGGFLVTPYFIRSVRTATGTPVLVADPLRACPRCALRAPREGTASRNASVQVDPIDPDPPRHPHVLVQPSAVHPRLAPRVITPQNAYLITSMMQSVIQFGTGVAAQSLHRVDLAGKTGTTNNYVDAWFGGFDPYLVTFVYVGRDDNRTLGYGQVGAFAALPMWIDFMGPALAHRPDRPYIPPPGIVVARIDTRTGLRCGPSDPHTMFEVFEAGKLPPLCPSARRHRHHHIF
jgi:penicillin-binding protein 1A